MGPKTYILGKKKNHDAPPTLLIQVFVYEVNGVINLLDDTDAIQTPHSDVTQISTSSSASEKYPKDIGSLDCHNQFTIQNNFI